MAIYRGNPESKDIDVAFVGKGVTYDTGGLNLKPTGSMEKFTRVDSTGRTFDDVSQLLFTSNALLSLFFCSLSGSIPGHA